MKRYNVWLACLLALSLTVGYKYPERKGKGHGYGGGYHHDDDDYGPDKDKKGKKDKDDKDCKKTPPKPVVEICTDGLDNDGDGLIDCADSDCASDPICILPPPKGVEICNDGLDNDSDSLVDCADPDCASDLICPKLSAPTLPPAPVLAPPLSTPTGPAPMIPWLPTLTIEGNCADGIDDDSDGLTDCADVDCEKSSDCIYTSAPVKPTLKL